MSQTYSDRVRVSIEDGVADVRLARADKMNAIDPGMFRGLVEAGEAISADASVRAVVLSGEGRAFCAGLDMASFQAMGNRDRSRETADTLARATASPANAAQRAAWVWQELPVPVIAAVHGVAYGGGFQIAMGADVRIVAPDARLSVMEIKWGLIPDMSGPQTLTRLVRLDVAKELTFTGRVLSGAEAAELGLATRVSESPLDDALEMAREIATKSPDAIRSAKKLLNAPLMEAAPEGLRLEEKLQRELIGSPNQVEAVRANLEKRKPSFRDPS